MGVIAIAIEGVVQSDEGCYDVLNFETMGAGLVEWLPQDCSKLLSCVSAHSGPVFPASVNFHQGGKTVRFQRGGKISAFYSYC